MGIDPDVVIDDSFKSADRMGRRIGKGAKKRIYRWAAIGISVIAVSLGIWFVFGKAFINGWKSSE